MAIGTSIFLLAVGAILRFAVYYSVRGVALGVVGVVLMVAGGIGLILSVAVFRPRSRRRTVIRRGPGGAVAEQESYVVDEPAPW